ncbi:MAG: hypothetical protein G01um10145_205 [Microgenomates group bacterium Gr01-1014_5]|nr:MAG: hypothetical protein G01um10145_205 [Microgenomates group bacterium Gr01-1014_5]
MIKITAPILIKNIAEDVKLPLTFFSNSKLTIILDTFTISERKKFFGLAELIINDGAINYKNNSYSFIDINQQHYLGAGYKIVIQSNYIKSPHELRDLQENLDFVFKLVLGCAVEISFLEGFFNKGKGIAKTYPNVLFRTRRKLSDLKNGDINKAKKIFDKTINSTDKKIDLIAVLLNSATSSDKLDITGALFVAILESIIVPEGGSEISYKFRMRMTKFLGKDTSFVNIFKGYYQKRSKVVHGSGVDQFTEEDIKELENYACILSEKYILKKFSEKFLDRLLIECK